MRSLHNLALAIVCLGGVGTSLAALVGSTFTYQGSLTDAGAPADGLYDMTFRLCSNGTCNGGGVVQTLNVNNVSVNDGLFTTALTFNLSNLTGDQRWLEIAVEGTTLCPRQELTATPHAVFSLKPWVTNGADVYYSNGKVGIGTSTPAEKLQILGGTDSELASGGYVVTGDTAGFNVSLDNNEIMARNNGAVAPFSINHEGGDVIVGGGGQNSHVLINRTTQVSGAEYFGIYAPVTGYGGMYIQCQDGNALPFYGYNTPNNTCWTYLDGESGDWRVYNSGTRLAVREDGGVHIYNGDLTFGSDSTSITFPEASGANAPMIQMFAAGTTNDDRMVIGHSPGFPLWGLEYQDSEDEMHFRSTAGRGVTIELSGGQVGIGTEEPEYSLHVADGTDSEPGSGGFIVTGLTTGANISIDNNEIMARNNGVASTLFLNNDGGDVVIAPGATTRVSVLEITGADVAEKFPVSSAVEPGMVVQIDSANPGLLCQAVGAYNRRVAGIVSGAGDIPVGAILGNLPGKENAPPIALSGRVYCWADASNGPIEAGDLLTTSDTPGHAMRATDHTRAPGAVIGKAMTELKEGKGLVLVLVSLQ